MSANPPSASSSCRRVSSWRQPGRSAGWPARSGCAARPRRSAAGRRAAAARRCRSRGRTGARRRRDACTADRAGDRAQQLATGRCAARRPPSGGRTTARSRTAGRWSCWRGQVLEAVRDRRARLPPPLPARAGSAGRSASSSVAGRAGSHGLCCAGMPQRPCAWRIARDQHLQVGDLGFPGAAARPGAGRRRAGQARPSPAGPARAAGRVAAAGARAGAPPTRPAWNGTSEECPSRT